MKKKETKTKPTNQNPKNQTKQPNNPNQKTWTEKGAEKILSCDVRTVQIMWSCKRKLESA